MELQDYVSMVCKQQREKRFSDSPQLSLGELISEFNKLDLKQDNGEFKSVEFDFGSAIPTHLNSWRGSYDELALGYKLTGYDSTEGHFDDCKADMFMKELVNAVGKEYTGWKGGEFIMDENTPIWVANSGNSGETAVVGVLDKGYKIVLITALCEF